MHPICVPVGVCYTLNYHGRSCIPVWITRAILVGFNERDVYLHLIYPYIPCKITVSEVAQRGLVGGNHANAAAASARALMSCRFARERISGICENPRISKR